MTSPEQQPVWMCVMCGATDLDPCKHSPSYHWAWNGPLQPVMDDGTLFRDKILNDQTHVLRTASEIAAEAERDVSDEAAATWAALLADEQIARQAVEERANQLEHERDDQRDDLALMEQQLGESLARFAVARREADQLRAAAQYGVRMLHDTDEYEIGEVVDRIEQAVSALRAALADVQAKEPTDG